MLLVRLTLHLDILDINNVYFDNMVGQVCPSGLQLDKPNTSHAEACLFWACVCQFQVVLFLPKFVINVATLILEFSVSHFWMVMFLALRPMGPVSLDSFVLLERLAVLLT